MAMASAATFCLASLGAALPSSCARGCGSSTSSSSPSSASLPSTSASSASRRCVIASSNCSSSSSAAPSWAWSVSRRARTSAGSSRRREISTIKPFTACRSSSSTAPLQSCDDALALRSACSFGGLNIGVGNGSKWFAIRHGRRVPRLGRPADQRKALLRGLTTELLRHGRIKTTKTRARAMRKYVDHMITLAKGGSLHQRRQALGFMYDKQLVHSIFAEVPDRYGQRNGGYTRIVRTMPRRGDNAPMAFIELV